MLRRWHTPEWKLRQRRITRKKHKREGVWRTNTPIQQSNGITVEDGEIKRPRVKRASINVDVPKKFSITNNTEEALAMFNKGFGHKEAHQEVYVNMSEVSTMTPDAILYLVSQLHYYDRLPSVRIAGNMPADPECRRLLVESGFTKYVRSNVPEPEPSAKILSIKSGSLVEPEIAKQVIDFSRGHLGIQRNKNSKSIYATIIECMANTRDHAYGPEDKDRQWWLIARYNDAEDKVEFAFLDNGYTIPRTIQQNFVEKAIGIDSSLIESALNGKFRTRTRKRHRGKGLPRMKQYNDQGFIKDLTIVSRRAFVRCNTGEVKNTGSRFHGTLLTWSLS